ncbi:MAG: flagellar hook-length control protein FliK [Campylobacterales bacterium]|nr:flagellar hook-length control protein FliK [Campylobacterales bacterium]
MQEALSLNTPKTAVLTKEKLAKMTSDLKGKEEKKGTDFLTMMLSQLASSTVKTPSTLTISVQDLPAKVVATEKTDLKPVESLSEEKATFAQLLALIETLNGGKTSLKFPKLTQKIETLLAQEGVMKELKEVKSLQDVMKLSQKYNLGLEKITFSSKEIKNLEALFPKLTQNNFFEPKKETIGSEALLKSKHPENPAKKTSEENTTLKDLLRAVETKKEAKTEVKSDVKTEVKSEEKSQPKVETKPEVKTDVKAEVKEVKSEEIKVATKKEDVKTVPKETIASHEKTSRELPQDTKASMVREVRAEGLKSQPVTAPVLEKIEGAQHPQAAKDTALKTLSELSQTESKGGEKESGGSEGETKNNNTFSREIIKNAQQNLKTPQLRQTFNTFAQDFKEQVENYKPPMMKIQLALNPKNLGEVDVTLINRGNNLHVNVTSNTNQTLSLFVQNQAEFKNALVNMGFTNLEMNFSQKERQDNPKGGTSKEDFSSEEFSDALEEETALELVLPNYV